MCATRLACEMKEGDVEGSGLACTRWQVEEIRPGFPRGHPLREARLPWKRRTPVDAFEEGREVAATKCWDLSHAGPPGGRDRVQRIVRLPRGWAPGLPQRKPVEHALGRAGCVLRFREMADSVAP